MYNHSKLVNLLARNKNNYTELNTRYMSAVKQAELAREMGLSKDDRIRTKGINRATLNLEGDVFESFFGALDTVSDDIYPGLGYQNSFNMIAHLFQNIEINDAESHAKTQVQQIFVRFELSNPKESSTGGKEVKVRVTPETATFMLSQGIDIDINDPIIIESSSSIKDVYEQIVNTLIQLNILDEIETVNQEAIVGQIHSFSVELSKKQLDFLATFDIYFDSPVIGYGEAPTKKEAGFIAYNNALNLLSEHGITTSWAEETKMRIDLSFPQTTQYLTKVIDRLNKEGFVSFYFAIPKKTSNYKGAIVQLIGVRSNGKQEVLSYTYSPKLGRKNGYNDAKSLVMKQYAESK